MRELLAGQAVLEGVMMRSRRCQALAVRAADGEIIVETTPLAPLSEKYPFLRWPLLRGVAALIEALSGSVGALGRSAQILEPEEEISRRELAVATCLALVLAIGLFFVLPSLVVLPLQGSGWGTVPLNICEGLVRIAILVGYLAAVSFSREIKRTFAYHGAEHKAIHCWEGKQGVDVSVASQCPRLHPRCGTSFLLLVVVTSILVFSLFSPPNLAVRIALRIVLLPLLAGVAYELSRWTARSDSVLARLAMTPGLALQRLTTREPDSGQLAVALAALKAVVDPDNNRGYNNANSARTGREV